MNRVAFFGGIALIIVGLAVWVLRPNSAAQKNTIKVFGGEFTLDTPALAVMVIGIVMMVVSPRFEGGVFPDSPPPTAAQPRMTQRSFVSDPVSINYAKGWTPRDARLSIPKNAEILSYDNVFDEHPVCQAFVGAVQATRDQLGVVTLTSHGVANSCDPHNSGATWHIKADVRIPE